MTQYGSADLPCVAANVQAVLSLQPVLVQESKTRIYIVHTIITIAIVAIVVAVSKPSVPSTTVALPWWLGGKAKFKPQAGMTSENITL